MKYGVGKIGNELIFVLDKDKALKPESGGFVELEIGDYIITTSNRADDYSVKNFLEHNINIKSCIVLDIKCEIASTKQLPLDYEYILEICRIKTKDEPKTFSPKADSFLKDFIQLTALFDEIIKESEPDNKLYYWEFKMSDGWHKSETRMTETQARAFVGDNVPMERLDALGFREE